MVSSAAFSFLTDRLAIAALEGDVGTADRRPSADPEVEAVRVREVGERTRLL